MSTTNLFSTGFFGAIPIFEYLSMVLIKGS